LILAAKVAVVIDGQMQGVVGTAAFHASGSTSYVTGQILAADRGVLASGVNRENSRGGDAIIQ
jgi:hypothetical protein